MSAEHTAGGSMGESAGLTSVERGWMGRMTPSATGKAAPLTAACLDGAEILELAERGTDASDYAARIDHVVSCAACRRLFKETKALLQAAAPVAEPALPQVAARAWDWLKSVTITPQTLPARVALSFAEDAAHPVPLIFEDGRCRGSYLMSGDAVMGGECRVHLECPDARPGTLIRVAFLAESGEETAAYFAVLTEDFLPSAELVVPLASAAGGRVALGVISDHAALPDEIADDLREGRALALQSAEDDDAAGKTASAWRMMAQRALTGTLSPALRAAFSEFAAEP